MTSISKPMNEGEMDGSSLDIWVYWLTIAAIALPILVGVAAWFGDGRSSGLCAGTRLGHSVAQSAVTY
jgi:hypothetical protein